MTHSAPPNWREDHDTASENVQELMAVRARGDAAGCRRAEQALIVEFLPVAFATARRYRRRGVDLEDLTQVARVGLVKAIRGWQPDKGGLVGYLMPTINGEIKRYFRDNEATIRIPRSLYEAQPRLAAAERSLRQRLSREPTTAELADATGLTTDQVRRIKLAPGASKPQSTDDGADWLTELASAEAERDIDAATIRAVLRPAITVLTGRERRIIALRFVRGQSQSQIAEALGVSQMHISRLLSAALAKLRSVLQPAMSTLVA